MNMNLRKLKRKFKWRFKLAFALIIPGAFLRARDFVVTRFLPNLPEHVPGVIEQVVALLPEGKQRVADLGCGRFRWVMNSYEITRVDIKRYPDVVQQDLNHDFSFGDNEFDGVVAIEIIEHLENPYHFLREATRIAKGWVIITTPTDDRWFNERKYRLYGHRSIVPKWLFTCYSMDLGWQVTEVRYNNESEEIMVVKIEPQ